MTIFEIVVTVLLLGISADLVLLLLKVKAMSQALTDLTTAVTNLETQSAATVSEIQSLSAGSDTEALPALTARIDTVVTNLTAAVAAASTPTA